MKALRQIGSLAFVLGLFVVAFVGVPWHGIVADDPPVPPWLPAAVVYVHVNDFAVLHSISIDSGLGPDDFSGFPVPATPKPDGVTLTAVSSP